MGADLTIAISACPTPIWMMGSLRPREAAYLVSRSLHPDAGGDPSVAEPQRRLKWVARRWARRWYFRSVELLARLHAEVRHPAAVPGEGPGHGPGQTSAWVIRFPAVLVPGYLDCWGRAYKELILRNGSDIEGFATVVIGFVDQYERSLVFLSALVAAGGVGLWLWREWRGSGSKPRPPVRGRRHAADLDRAVLDQSGKGLYRFRVQPRRRVPGFRLGFPAPLLLPAAA